MSMTFTDSTSNTQRMTFNNSGQSELGHGTPSTDLSVNGVQLYYRGGLFPARVSSNSLQRLSGSVSNNAKNTFTVSTAIPIGLGSISSNGVIYNTTSNSFSVGAQTPNTAQTFNYAVI